MLSANFLGGNRACRLLVLIRYPPQMGEKSWREVASGASRACCQAKIAQATTHQRYRLCMGLQLASQAMGRGAQSRAEHACKCNKGQGLAPRIVRHRIDCTALQAATRPTIDKKRRNISSCRAMDPENSFTSCGSTADREDPTYLASTRACVCVYSRWQRGKAAISVNS